MINIETLMPPRPNGAPTDEQGNRRKQESGHCGTRGRSIEYEDSQRHRTPAEDGRLQHASGGRVLASREEMVCTQQKYGITRRSLPHSRLRGFATRPNSGAETLGDCKRSAPEGDPERNDHHGDQNEPNASRSVIASRGDLIRKRIPAAADTHFGASKASQVNGTTSASPPAGSPENER